MSNLICYFKSFIQYNFLLSECYIRDRKGGPHNTVISYFLCGAEQPTKHMALLLLLYTPTSCISLNLSGRQNAEGGVNESPTPVIYI